MDGRVHPEGKHDHHRAVLELILLGLMTSKRKQTLFDPERKANLTKRASTDKFLAWSVFNRDLMQLEFFRRLLEEAADTSVPLLERLKFLAVFYVGDMGSTFGYSSASENKAKLEGWKKKDPIKVSGGQCTTAAKSVGDAKISEAGRQLLADGLQRLLDAEKTNGTITRVFRASRNAERDRPAEEWTAEFTRKANMIITARCSN